MVSREKLGEEWWWMLNMEVHGKGDALGSLFVEEYYEGLDYSMIYSVGI